MQPYGWLMVAILDPQLCRLRWVSNWTKTEVSESGNKVCPIKDGQSISFGKTLTTLLVTTKMPKLVDSALSLTEQTDCFSGGFFGKSFFLSQMPSGSNETWNEPQGKPPVIPCDQTHSANSNTHFMCGKVQANRSSAVFPRGKMKLRFLEPTEVIFRPCHKCFWTPLTKVINWIWALNKCCEVSLQPAGKVHIANSPSYPSGLIANSGPCSFSRRECGLGPLMRGR